MAVIVTSDMGSSWPGSIDGGMTDVMDGSIDIDEAGSMAVVVVSSMDSEVADGGMAGHEVTVTWIQRVP